MRILSATTLQIQVRYGRTWAHYSLYKTEIMAFICTSTLVEVYNYEMDNDNSSWEILSKRAFYHRFPELTHF